MPMCTGSYVHTAVCNTVRTANKKICRHIETAELAVGMSHVRTSTHRSLLSPGTSMVRVSHRRSEGRGFDSHLGLGNIFSEFAIKLE